MKSPAKAIVYFFSFFFKEMVVNMNASWEILKPTVYLKKCAKIVALFQTEINSFMAILKSVSNK